MLGLDDSPKIRKLVDDAVAIFGDQIAPMLTPLKTEIDEEIIRLLTEKIAALMFHDRVNDNPDISYITIWQGGKSEINQVYMSPKIGKLLGYSPPEIEAVSFKELVGDEIITYVREQRDFKEETVPREEARAARREEYLGNRQWEGFYRIKKKNGDSIWVMDKSILTKYINAKGDNVVYVSEGILLESTQLMARKPT
jgi:PAS domain-containing protein